MARSKVVFPDPDGPITRRELSAVDGEAHAGQDAPHTTAKMHVADVEDYRHDVGAFHRCSSRRAAAASGSDMAR